MIPEGEPSTTATARLLATAAAILLPLGPTSVRDVWTDSRRNTVEMQGDPAVPRRLCGDLVERAAVRLGEWPALDHLTGTYKVTAITTDGIGISVAQPRGDHASRLEPLGDTTGALVSAIRDIGRWATTWPLLHCRIRVRASATLNGAALEIHLQGGDTATLAHHLLDQALHVSALLPGDSVRVAPGVTIRAMLLAPFERPIGLQAQIPGSGTSSEP